MNLPCLSQGIINICAKALKCNVTHLNSDLYA